MKIFRSSQIRQIDEYTIRNEPIASVDLMERAAMKLFEWYTNSFTRNRRVMIFAGPGNNGGDGLALARMLAKDRYESELWYLHFTDNNTDDWKLNRERLEKETNVPFKTIETSEQFPLIRSDDVIIDAIFGSGLSRPVTGFPADIIRLLNETHNTIIAVDIPSGLMGEDNSLNNPENIIRADYTLSFHFAKLAFLFRENEIFTGKWIILPIGLDPEAVTMTKTPWELLEKQHVVSLLRKRNKFDHKGIYGHGLLIGGSYGKMGAVSLGAKAALRTGAGLVSCHIPSCGNTVLQVSVPEAMVRQDKSDKYISDIGSPGVFDAFGIGPGMGLMKETAEALHRFLICCNKPLVIDADALNILSANREWLSCLPGKAILTPHPKEFERLTGKSISGFNRLEKQVEFSEKNNCIIILKGAHTSVTDPLGNVWFNNTGNPGMATAGSGDVLTGMILSLLAQGYKPEDAAVTGVFLHGMAGDIAAERSCYEAVIASDIIDSISGAFNKIREET